MVDTRLGSLAVRVRGNDPVLWHNLFVDDRTWNRVEEDFAREPRPISALPAPKLAPKYWNPLGYLYEIGFTLTSGCIESTSAAPSAARSTTPDHDGRIIAEWATTHKDPSTSISPVLPAGP